MGNVQVSVELWPNEVCDKLVVEEGKRLGILRQVHNELGHKGIFTTCTHILECFWWPYFDDNIRWYLKTYYECQV